MFPELSMFREANKQIAIHRADLGIGNLRALADTIDYILRGLCFTAILHRQQRHVGVIVLMISPLPRIGEQGKATRAEKNIPDSKREWHTE